MHICAAPAYSTERTELFMPDDVRTATLDLKGRKSRNQARTPVPFADVEDDNNLSTVDPYRMNQVSGVYFV